MKYAAIDIGTNAARLLIGEVIQHNGYAYVQKLSYTRVPLRLGMDVFNDGIIPIEKQKMFVKTIKAFKLIADVYGVKATRACATSAMREASNGVEVQSEILKKTGVNIEIIGGEEEGNLIFSTFSLISRDKKKPFIVIDVGGGSTEITIFENGQKIAGKSFRVGTIRLLKEKVASDLWEELNTWLEQHIPDGAHFEVYGTGGNINKLHKLLEKKFMEPIEKEELHNIYLTLSNLTLADRIDQFLLKPDRADVIVPACQIYYSVLHKINATEILVPKIGLSDGLIYQMHLDQID